MHTKYEAPELTLVGSAEEVVMVIGTDETDAFQQAAPDFEFEMD